MSLILAIDQGTTTSKCLLVDGETGEIVGRGAARVGISYPRPGWVEQDANDIWTSVENAAKACIADAKCQPSDIAGVAISNQRESVLAWDAESGTPLTPVLGWQDSRTAEWCKTLGQHRDLVFERTGLPLDAMFSAPKMRWLLDEYRLNHAGDAQLPELRIGTIDAFLIKRLTGADVIEAGNASRTLLLNIDTVDWDEDLLRIFGIRREVLPEVVGSTGPFDVVQNGALGLGEVPVLAVLADSHAALYHHGRGKPGIAKATYGTGSSVMVPSQRRIADADPGTTTIAWQLPSAAPQYATEGNILTAGAGFDWLANVLGSDDSAPGGARLSTLAAQVPDSAGVAFVPAFTGLGAPYWDRNAKGTITGITGATTAAHLARAAFDGVANQVADVVESALTSEAAQIVADGGATASNILMQTQADLVGLPVVVSDAPEASALGAADLASQVLTGVAPPVSQHRARFEPRLDSEERNTAREQWKSAVNRARGLAV